MKDYNAITADLLMKSPHGVDCYVSNISHAHALQDIHLKHDAVVRINRRFKHNNDVIVYQGITGMTVYRYVIPVHLAVKELFNGCVSLIEDAPDELTPRDKLLCSFLCKIG